MYVKLSRPKWNATELFIIMLAYEYVRGGSRQQQTACFGEEKHSDTWWQRQCLGENNAHERFGLFYCCLDISGSFSLFYCCYEHSNPFPTNSFSFLLWITTAIHANVIHFFFYHFIRVFRLYGWSSGNKSSYDFTEKHKEIYLNADA